ncbi:hypothetical protein GCM10023084_78850 [Streptomyces lacrimifluminis]|uniref:Uncharacterized protein n=1 Tax=Streptomyces lacrimifluminis TaxID=1500077 RepID=A0A917PAT7_9ACTN|nr:hypothetical protein GCM10012282_77200 [Streptomyces lacrimifluminis]
MTGRSQGGMDRTRLASGENADQDCGCVRRAQAGPANALRSALGDGTRLDTVVVQEQQRFRLFLRAECVEPFDAL